MPTSIEGLIDGSFGVIFLGGMLSSITSGILICLAWQYHTDFGRCDKPVFLVLSVAMFSLGAASTATLVHFGYDNLVTHYGDALYILRLNWAFPCLMTFIGVSCFILNVFLSYRIWVASLKTWRAVPVVILLLSGGGGGVSMYLAGWYSQQSTNLSLTTRPDLIWAWFALDTTSEAIATGALLWLLVLKPRREHGRLLRNQTVLAGLVLRAVETNFLSLVFHIVTMALFGTSTTTFYAYTVPAFCLTNIYGINLFSQLLSRPALQPRPSTGYDTNFVSIAKIKVVSEVDVEVSEPTAAQRSRGARAYEKHCDGPSLCDDRRDIELGLSSPATAGGSGGGGELAEWEKGPDLMK